MKNTFTFNIVTLLGIIVGIVILVNMLMLVLTKNNSTTISLLNSQINTLSQDEQIIKSSRDINKQYANEIEIISQVFPTDSTIADVIAAIEEQVRASANSYSLQFVSESPINKSGQLPYLLLRLNVEADFSQLTTFFSGLETLPYMTHIDEIIAQTPEGFASSSTYGITLRIYVQNPFSTK